MQGTLLTSGDQPVTKTNPTPLNLYLGSRVGRIAEPDNADYIYIYIYIYKICMLESFLKRERTGFRGTVMPGVGRVGLTEKGT